MAMEMYYTRRSKKAHQLTMEMERSNATDSPVLGPLHHVPPPPPSSHRCTLLLQDTHFSIENDGDKSQMPNHVKPGCLYEIDHAQLPPRTPVQLKSIRVAMVCDITDISVAVRFPSMESLREFFNYSLRETHPALNEKFIMGIALAKRVLIRLVPEAIFTEKKGLLEFWLISSSPGDGKNNIAVTQRKKGSCLSEALKGNGMVRWGIRRQVKYLGRHRESCGLDVNAQNSSSSFVDGVFEESQMEFGASFDEGNQSMEEGKEGDADEKREEKGEEEEEADDDDDDDDDEEEEEEEEEEKEEEEEEEEEEPREKIKEESNKNLKRKRYSFRNLGARKTKKAKLERISKQKQMQKKNQAKKKKGRLRLKESPTLRDPKDRWSTERYKLAERNLLAVMKSKGATAEKPILRPQLRAEARKRIGDTGLLDHLLKHMAGKLAPGGQERFRRRHNPDGAMEYWLESADLVNIRKDAGVADPFWVPPPGWKLGDSPTQDPICARELKLLKDDISMIKRDLELMAGTKMKLEEEVARLRREVIEISSKGRSQDENQASITVASSRSEISQKLNQLVNSLESSKCGFGDAHDSLEKYKEQLMVVSDFVKEIEERFGKPTPKVAERAVKSSETSLMVAEVTQMREKKAEEREAKSKQEQVQALIGATDEGETEVSEIEKEDKKGAEEEEKAARRRRLKSGFRICKPEGSFLWPNMMVKDNNINSPSNNMFVQVEVPTPPSVSSSTTTAPRLLHHHYHPSLVKPLAEKRAVTVTVSPLSNPGIYEVDGTTPLVNLNEAPPNLDPMPLQGGNARKWESGAINEVMMANTFCCSSSATSEIVNNWLALSTLKSASDDSSHG